MTAMASTFCDVLDGATGPRLPDQGPVYPPCPGRKRSTRGGPECSVPGLWDEEAVHGAAQQGAVAALSLSHI